MNVFTRSSGKIMLKMFGINFHLVESPFFASIYVQRQQVADKAITKNS